LGARRHAQGLAHCFSGGRGAQDKKAPQPGKPRGKVAKPTQRIIHIMENPMRQPAAT
jgi:hypothetical protein